MCVKEHHVIKCILVIAFITEGGDSWTGLGYLTEAWWSNLIMLLCPTHCSLSASGVFDVIVLSEPGVGELLPSSPWLTEHVQVMSCGWSSVKTRPTLIIMINSFLCVCPVLLMSRCCFSAWNHHLCSGPASASRLHHLHLFVQPCGSYRTQVDTLTVPLSTTDPPSLWVSHTPRGLSWLQAFHFPKSNWM